MIIDTDKFREWTKDKAVTFDRENNELLVVVPFEESTLKDAVTEDEKQRFTGKYVWDNAFDIYQKETNDIER